MNTPDLIQSLSSVSLRNLIENFLLSQIVILGLESYPYQTSAQESMIISDVFQRRYKGKRKSLLFHKSTSFHPHTPTSFVLGNMIYGFNSGQSLLNPQCGGEISIAEGLDQYLSLLNFPV